LVNHPTLPLVQLNSANGLVIDFHTQNGQTVTGASPVSKEIPHLVLFRNGELTRPEERTLHLTLAGLEVPPKTGLTFTLRVETQHGDPDRGGNVEYPLSVWEHREWIPGTQGGENVTLFFEKEFLEATGVEGEMVTTPTDYFRIEIALYSGASLAGGPTSYSPGNLTYTYIEEYAFLMESQWIAPLYRPDEITPNTVPAELAIYYCDMFPIQNKPYDLNSRLPRAAVHRYIQEEIGPALLEAEWVQTHDWGFSWQENWTGFRSGSYRDRLNVALVRGDLWFHGMAPGQASSGISINLDWPKRAAYDSLADWILSVFHHELFHNLQRNQKIANGKWGDIDGKHDAWKVITEGTAVLATSVGQPEVEFVRSRERRMYMTNANRFLAGDRYFNDDLTTSYKEINPYNTTLYWRFIYEQCSGPQGDPEIGMQVVRQTLNNLYASDDLERVSKEELVEAFPNLMNKVFSKVAWCPFRTYQESLRAFSHAIYALRLEGGRCNRAVGLAGCGFYDPLGLYSDPHVEEIIFTGEGIVYNSGIGSSFGMEFIEITLDPQVEGRNLSLVFELAEEVEAEFSVQVWRLKSDRDGHLVRIPAPKNKPDLLEIDRAKSATVYEIDRIDLEQNNRLGLIITRLDSHEALDGVGAFTIYLVPR
jgi:hypothetical protein